MGVVLIFIRHIPTMAIPMRYGETYSYDSQICKWHQRPTGKGHITTYTLTRILNPLKQIKDRRNLEAVEKQKWEC